MACIIFACLFLVLFLLILVTIAKFSQGFLLFWAIIDLYVALVCIRFMKLNHCLLLCFVKLGILEKKKEETLKG